MKRVRDIAAMDRFTPVHVCYCQFQVLGSADGDGSLGLHGVGDDLLQVTGGSQLTGMTRLHTGQVEVGVAVLPAPPADLADGWDAATETTLWCPDGRITVCGLMDDFPDALRDIMVGGAALYRVRVHARERRRESYQIEAERRPVEQYQVSVWPMDADVGLKTLRVDDLPPMGVRPDPARAAGWAMQRLVALANPDPRLVALRELAERMRRANPPEVPAAVARVAVQRVRWMPAGRAQQVLDHLGKSFGARADDDELVWPASDIEIRLRPAATPDGVTARWRWVPRPGSATAVSDVQASTVEIRAVPNHDRGAADLVVVHRGVRAQDAVLLGLIWDHLLDRAGTAAVDGAVPPLPWEPLFAASSSSLGSKHGKRTHRPPMTGYAGLRPTCWGCPASTGNCWTR